MTAAIPPTTLAANLVAAQSFVDWINDLPRDGSQGTGPSIPEGYVWSLDRPGAKVVRIVVERHGSKSVHAFVDLATGDLYKAAGWKAPAKGARGNIATADGLADVQARFNWSGGYLYINR
jgi:hypothetical protein